MIGDLALQGGLEYPLGQLLQGPALAGQLQALAPGPVHQHRDQLVIRNLRSLSRLSGPDLLQLQALIRHLASPPCWADQPLVLQSRTKLRWIAPKLVAAASEKVQGANVRTLHVLAPAPLKAGPATAAADPASPTVPAAPVQRRTPPDGYRRAIEAHRQAVRPSTVDRAIAEAVERQTAAMRKLSRRAFPEPDVVPNEAPASIEVTRAQCRRQAAATGAAALRRARQKCAARESGTPADVL
ncbi:hypothetical protein [Streptomyces sp. NPDC016626]|uniref:hypothetical protein n=1 Tax=Streptomyces sp. NPDC016626 TaxID=3364968 RepID=UPI0036F8638B